MSDATLISPLLDGFAMGPPISEHSGIRCCPAIKENTDKKYIVKIISIPASQRQLDALLLAGAYRDASGAMDYYRGKGEDILKEAEMLKNLSRLEGFLSYEAWQMEPITRNRLGYEIYLVGSYKRSLEKHIRHHAITHLEAINLGLDMCNALTVSRQAGALYVNLKPSNIFLSDKKEYRIGDLGFIPLNELRFTALPDKYYSSYTPPELYDPMASLNLTADTYALGMILYQLYNDGNLPFRGKAPEEMLPTPANADYEIAEIIAKAIHPDPEQRWTDPAEMGKALASYLQRNTVNDVPITPLKISKPKKKKKAAAPQAEKVSAIAVVSTSEQTDPAPEQAAAEEISLPAQEPAVEEIIPMAEEAESQELLTEESAQVPPVDPEISEEKPEEEAAEADEISAELLPESDILDPDDLVIEETAVNPDTVETEDVLDEETPADEVPVETSQEDYGFSEEFLKMLAKANDLIAHETPEDIVMQEPEDPFGFVKEDAEEIDDSDYPYDPLMDDEETEEKPKKKKKEKKSKTKKEKKFTDRKRKRRRKKIISSLVMILILLIMAFAGFWVYLNVYLQTIDSLTLEGDRSQITVYVESDIKDGLLFASCSNNYGKSHTVPVTDGKAVFTDLEPNTLYTILLRVDGFHKLVGKTSDFFTTEATTNIVSFTSMAGSEDGSVVLNFVVDGEEPLQWALTYSTEGEKEKRETFTGHSITINGLSVGKMYTFTLDAGQNLSLSGNKTLDLIATRLILAKNLSVTSSTGSDMTIRWEAPGDVIIDSWTVRCYNDSGYDEQLTVTDTEVLFTGIDATREYTVEVTASGMTQPARTSITANPINIDSLHIDESDTKELKVSWDYTGNAPEGGWLLMYSVDGSENHVVKAEDNHAAVSPKIPGGKYHFTLHAADGTSIFNSIHSFTVSDAADFEESGLKADMLTADLVKTPEDKNWNFETIGNDAIATEFAVGDPISVVLRSSDSFYLPGTESNILYVIRDSFGNVLTDYVSAEKMVWKNIWLGGDSKNGELDVPDLPQIAGSYVLHLYINGMSVAELPFTLSD